MPPTTKPKRSTRAPRAKPNPVEEGSPAVERREVVPGRIQIRASVGIVSEIPGGIADPAALRETILRRLLMVAEAMEGYRDRLASPDGNPWDAASTMRLAMFHAEASERDPRLWDELLRGEVGVPKEVADRLEKAVVSANEAAHNVLLAYASMRADMKNTGASWTRLGEDVALRPDMQQRWTDLLHLRSRAQEKAGAAAGRVRQQAAHVAAPARSKEPIEDQQPAPVISMSDDFTSARWGVDTFTFGKGNQAETVRLLWNARGKGDGTLKTETIQEGIDSAADRFRMELVFRGHPAFRRMIVSPKRGVWKLAEPAPVRITTPHH